MNDQKTKIWVINGKDNVGTIIGDDAAEGTEAPIVGGAEGRLTLASSAPYGHKVALMDIPGSSDVYKYGVAIGRLLCDVKQGEHVHTHNLESLRGRGDLE